ncbi:hypothetical protein Tco_0866627 [Tanacetum coccineum]
MVVAEVGKELVWLKNFLEELAKSVLGQPECYSFRKEYNVSRSNKAHQDKISLSIFENYDEPPSGRLLSCGDRYMLRAQALEDSKQKFKKAHSRSS